MLPKKPEKIFAILKISKDELLNEISILLAKQELSEYLMDIEYLENKYHKNYHEFDKIFRKQKASYEMENDWMKWKFAIESRDYWQNILSEGL
jgi:hypothetical protein